jgi:hypothetical protein
MIVKALAALLALVPVSAFAAANETNILPWQHPEVVRVDCLFGRGSAFYVGPTTLLSVAHVTTMLGCTINGKPFTVLRSKGDFSIISVATPSTNWLRIDCGGFVAGKLYEAIGYARGLDTQTTVELEATGKIDGQLSRLGGVFTVIPGQSGGPIRDELTGRVTGTVNTYDAEDGLSGSVALKDTPVCDGVVV